MCGGGGGPPCLSRCVWVCECVCVCVYVCVQSAFPGLCGYVSVAGERGKGSMNVGLRL